MALAYPRDPTLIMMEQVNELAKDRKNFVPRLEAKGPSIAFGIVIDGYGPSEAFQPESVITFFMAIGEMLKYYPAIESSFRIEGCRSSQTPLLNILMSVNFIITDTKEKARERARTITNIIQQKTVQLGWAFNGQIPCLP